MDRFDAPVLGTFDGGCLCGAIRYRIRNPHATVCCHCRQCQRASGAPAIVWTRAKEPDSGLLDGVPLTYRSSDRARRQFCGDCGSALFLLYDDEPDVVWVATGTLDEPARVPPRGHVWTSSATAPLPDDGLPRRRAAWSEG